eukprot:scaffold185655_cov40-Tisochrysis_lutea.AAC.1
MERSGVRWPLSLSSAMAPPRRQPQQRQRRITSVLLPELIATKERHRPANFSTGFSLDRRSGSYRSPLSTIASPLLLSALGEKRAIFYFVQRV